jgi:hypothetical protein
MIILVTSFFLLPLVFVTLSFVCPACLQRQLDVARMIDAR